MVASPRYTFSREKKRTVIITRDWRRECQGFIIFCFSLINISGEENWNKRSDKTFVPITFVSFPTSIKPLRYGGAILYNYNSRFKMKQGERERSGDGGRLFCPYSPSVASSFSQPHREWERGVYNSNKKYIFTERVVIFPPECGTFSLFSIRERFLYFFFRLVCSRVHPTE